MMRSQKGFSLVEMLVVLGLFVLAAMGGVNLLQNNLRQAKHLELSLEMMQLKVHLKRYLMQENFCEKNFTGKVLGPEIDLALVMPDDSDFLSTSKKYGQLNLERVYIEDLTPTPNGANEIELVVRPINGNVQKRKLRSISVKTVVYTDGANTVTGCSDTPAGVPPATGTGMVLYELTAGRGETNTNSAPAAGALMCVVSGVEYKKNSTETNLGYDCRVERPTATTFNFVLEKPTEGEVRCQFACLSEV